MTYVIELYIHVRWAWLRLRLTSMLLGILFFVITMSQSAKVDIWKSSIFAFLYHGLQDGQHNSAVTSTLQIEELARNHPVALEQTTSHGDTKLI